MRTLVCVPLREGDMLAPMLAAVLASRSIARDWQVMCRLPAHQHAAACESLMALQKAMPPGWRDLFAQDVRALLCSNEINDAESLKVAAGDAGESTMQQLFRVHHVVQEALLRLGALAANPLATLAPFSQADVDIQNDEVAWRGFFEVRRLRLAHRRYEGGWMRDVGRELFVRHRAAAALLYDDAHDCVVMVEQFRVGALACESPWCLEMIAGIADKDEPVGDLVVREAKEEAGCTITALRPLYTYLPSPGGSNECLEMFIARVDCTQVEAVAGLADEHEDIKTYVVPRVQLMELMEAGRLGNAATLIALQWLDRFLLSGQARESLFAGYGLVEQAS